MTLSTSTDHLVIMSIIPSFLSQPMRCIVYKSYRLTRYQFFSLTSPFYGQGLLLFESEEGLEDVVEGLRDSVPVPDLGVMLVRGGELLVGGGDYFVGTPRRDLHHSLPIWEEPSL